MALKWPYKDPNEVLDYTINWAPRLPSGDEISASDWPDFPAGITKDDDDFDTSTTTVWLSGGTLAETYTMTNRVTTTEGRTMDQTVTIKIKAK